MVSLTEYKENFRFSIINFVIGIKLNKSDY